MEITAEIKAILISLAVGALAIGALWLHRSGYDEGANAVKAADAKALAAQIAADNQRVEAASHANDTELAADRAYIAANPVGTVSLCLSPPSHPSAVPAPGSVSRSASAAPANVQPVPAGDNQVRPAAGPNIGDLLSLLAERADAVSAQLRDYQSVDK